jgi:hypothetical protein
MWGNLRTRLRNFTHSSAWIYALVCVILRTRLRYSTQSPVVSSALTDQKTITYKVVNVSACRVFRYVQHLCEMLITRKAWPAFVFEAGNLSKQHPFIWVQLAKIPDFDWYQYATTLHAFTRFSLISSKLIATASNNVSGSTLSF